MISARARATFPPGDPLVLDAACLAYAAIGRAVLPVVAPAELAERARALDRGELAEADARRTVNDLGLVAVMVGALSPEGGHLPA